MRLFALILIAISFVVPAAGEEAAPSPVNLSVVVSPGDTSHYNLKVNVTGTTTMPGSAQPMPVDVALDLSVVIATGERDKDGSLQMTVSVDAAMAKIAGQQLTLAKETFPKMTALIDKDGNLIRLFSADPMSVKLPGINYRNFMLLFNPYAPPGDLAIGATWKKTVSLPPEPEKYELSSALEKLENMDGIPTARIKSDVVVIPPDGADYTAKGSAVSNFSLDGAKLVKSHVEMVVKMKSAAPSTPSGEPTAATPGDTDTVVKLDIVKVNPAPANTATRTNTSE